MQIASQKFFELSNQPQIKPEQYEYYEAMRMLAANIEALYREIEDIKQQIRQLPRR